MLGEIEGRRRRGWQRMRWLDDITNSMDMSLGAPLGVGDGQECLGCCSSWGRKESDMTEWLSWSELNTEKRTKVFISLFCSSFSNSPSNEYSGLISFRIDWFDLLAVQRTLQKSSPTSQFKCINSSVLSFLYGPLLTSIHNYWNNHSYTYCLLYSLILKKHKVPCRN